MNRTVLAELQRLRCYPSITLLINTTPGSSLSSSEYDTAIRLAALVDDRLEGDVSDTLRNSLVGRLTELISTHAGDKATTALAICVSPEHSSVVRLGRGVQERVNIDDTFATRDMVADLNRTAVYRVITVSERTTRLFVGDRQRLVEQRNDRWPMERQEEQTLASWTRDVAHHLRSEQSIHPLPTVLAGVQRTVRGVSPALRDTIGAVAGNHDRTSASMLHSLAWPLVTDWLRNDGQRAMSQLDEAISTSRYAGGIGEIWPLAVEGRVATLIVETDFAMPARLDEHNQLHAADDPDHPEVYDDIVDEAIEAVLAHHGQAVMVPSGSLDRHDRIAAVLRY